MFCGEEFNNLKSYGHHHPILIVDQIQTIREVKAGRQERRSRWNGTRQLMRESIQLLDNA